MLSIGVLPDKSADTYSAITKPYFKKANIDDTALRAFNSYFKKKYNELEEYRKKAEYLTPKAEIKRQNATRRRGTRRYLIFRPENIIKDV